MNLNLFCVAHFAPRAFSDGAHLQKASYMHSIHGFFSPLPLKTESVYLFPQFLNVSQQLGFILEFELN